MFCDNCGKQMPDDSIFCQECGAKQETEPEVKTTAPAPTAAPVPLSPEEAAKAAKRKKMTMAAAGGVLALFVIYGIASTVIKPTINLNNYLTVAFEGYDTVGEAVATFDMEKFEEDYGKKLGKDSYAAQSFLANCMSGELDVDRGLSNGDIVTYSWDCDDDYALKNYDYKLKYVDAEYTVSDLKEARAFDPFEGIEVVFDGISPNGSADISGGAKDVAAQELSYQLDISSGLQNGDIVTVTASIRYGSDPTEYCISNYGKIPSTLEKQFTVAGLNSYVRSLEEVSSAALEEMQNQAKDVYDAMVAQSWAEDEKLSSFTYLGSYLLTKKSQESWGSADNVLYLVYKVQVQHDYTNDAGETYNQINDIYWYISYNDLIVDPAGAITVNITKYQTPSERFTVDSGINSGWWSTKSWNYYGYQTLDELYKVAVTANAESYKHIEDVDESLAVSVVLQEQTEVVEEMEITAEGGIIFPNSSEELLVESAIEACTDEELRYAVNELYARHGYIFNDDALREYYNQFEWYEETVKADDFEMTLFNEIENENIIKLQKERDSR